MKKKISLGLIGVLVLTTLSGCGVGGSYAEINELNSMESLNSDSQTSATSNYSLSYSDKENLVYAQVSDRTLLDTTLLSACSEEQITQITNYMNVVDQQLVGSISAEEGVLSEELVSYLLSEFEKTPFYWQRTQTVIQGLDVESDTIVVDVKYKTIGFNKDVIDDSYIVKGDVNYDKMMEIRYTRYLALLAQMYGNTSGQYTSPEDFKKNNEEYLAFVEAYGKPEDIYKSQLNLSLYDRIQETGNQVTYNGCIDTPIEQSGATMTIRYILVPNIVLGVSLGLDCKHLYVTDYQLDSDPTEGLSIFANDGYQTVTDSVYNLLYSYFTCIDESDFRGLNKLTNGFANLDKYYTDMFDTTYNKHENFTISIFDIVGTHVTCGVTISSKVRGKGSNMAYPSYTDRYYAEIDLVDDALQVKNLVLLSRKLQGEPAITTDAKTDKTGFSATIDLSFEDKQAIEELICNFSAKQLLNDTTSDEFAEIVDTSITSSDLATLTTNMSGMVVDETSGTVNVKTKAVWLTTYQQGTSSYASVKCKELFQRNDNIIMQADVNYDCMVKGGKWYIIGYYINNSAKLDTTNLNSTGALCLVSPGKVDSYNTQITSSEKTTDETSTTQDVTITIDHEEYTPVLKQGKKEQGKQKLTKDTLENADYDDFFVKLAEKKVSVSKESLDSANSALVDLITASGQTDAGIITVNELAREIVAMYWSNKRNLYSSDEELTLDIQAMQTQIADAGNVWSGLGLTNTEEVLGELNSMLANVK